MLLVVTMDHRLLLLPGSAVRRRLPDGGTDTFELVASEFFAGSL